MSSVSNPPRLRGKVALVVAAIAAAAILYQGWENLRSASPGELAVVEGRGVIVGAERRFHSSGRRIRLEWEEICALFHLQGTANLFQRCFAPREFAAVKLEVQSLGSLRIWIDDPACARVPQKGRQSACPARQIEAAGKLIATAASAPSCSFFGGSCPPREPGAQEWTDIKRFPLGVEVGLLKPVDGSPRHYLAPNQYGFASEWVEYRFLGFEGANGSINIFRSMGADLRPEEATIDIRVLQHEPFLLSGARYSETNSVGDFSGFDFWLLRGDRRSHCVFYSGQVEDRRFTVRGWYCAPKGEVMSVDDVRKLFESIRVLPPAQTRL